eukprot:1407976-Prymnesium_polylepis.1
MCSTGSAAPPGASTRWSMSSVKFLSRNVAASDKSLLRHRRSSLTSSMPASPQPLRRWASLSGGESHAVLQKLHSTLTPARLSRARHSSMALLDGNVDQALMLGQSTSDTLSRESGDSDDIDQDCDNSSILEERNQVMKGRCAAVPRAREELRGGRERHSLALPRARRLWVCLPGAVRVDGCERPRLRRPHLSLRNHYGDAAIGAGRLRGAAVGAAPLLACLLYTSPSPRDAHES